MCSCTTWRQERNNQTTAPPPKGDGARRTAMRAPNEFAKSNLAPVVNRREAWRSEIETQRNAIYRDCPTGFAVDRGHALQRVAGVMLAGVGSVLAQRYLIRGLLADGFSVPDIAHALRASPEQIASAQGALPIWKQGAEKLAALLARSLPVNENDA